MQRAYLTLLFFFIFWNVDGLALSLQKLIDDAQPHDEILLQPGTYSGHFVINKPLTLTGQEGVILDGQSKGSIISIKSDFVVIQNLTLQNTGKRHDQIDAAIAVYSSHNQILNNVMTKSLFGISLQKANNNRIEGNTISSFYRTQKDQVNRKSQHHHVGEVNHEKIYKGDGIRLFASNHNLLQHNKIHHVKDVIFLYSYDNRYLNNHVSESRYGIHLMYTERNLIKGNHFFKNIAGIVLMYGKNIHVEDNLVQASSGAVGYGITLKDMDDVTLVQNTITHCSNGIYFNSSPANYGSKNLIFGNQIAFNTRGFYFHSSLKNNIIKGNSFIGNIRHVQVGSRGHAQESIWGGNYWDDYEGIDQNQDGYGDIPKKYFAYLDDMLLEDESVQFFFASPSLSLLTAINKLIPIIEPRLIFVEEKPAFQNQSEFLNSPENLKFVLPFDEEDDD